jgi:hypothetical protein
MVTALMAMWVAVAVMPAEQAVAIAAAALAATAAVADAAMVAVAEAASTVVEAAATAVAVDTGKIRLDARNEKPALLRQGGLFACAKISSLELPVPHL